MDELIVAGPEAVAIFLKSWRWHGRIAESRMPFDAGRPSLRNISPCGFETIVIALPGCFGKLRGWRRRVINHHRLWMRTSGQRDRQQQRCQCKPFLHIVSSLVEFHLSPAFSARRFLIETPI